jgi:hypothetical protein
VNLSRVLVVRDPEQHFFHIPTGMKFCSFWSCHTVKSGVMDGLDLARLGWCRVKGLGAGGKSFVGHTVRLLHNILAISFPKSGALAALVL